MKHYRLPIRVDKRYSAACTIRQLRKARRFGARVSNAYIRETIRADRDLCWN